MLPDDVLLEIFDLYRKIPRLKNDYENDFFSLSMDEDAVLRLHKYSQKWHFLVHVCRRWRQITFASPRRLDLQVLCKHGTPVRNYLDIWPAIPIVVAFGGAIMPDDEDNAIAALEHPDRVSRVELLHVTGSQLGKIATVMQVPFPVLTHFSITTDPDMQVPVIPSGFLGGSAPCLQEFQLSRIPFPALPTFLLSASNLVILRLEYIPPNGYVSPESMVAGLAALPRLRDLQIIFEDDDDIPHPGRIHLPPVTPTVLPALTLFAFIGDCKYLEDFVARIDAPQLTWFEITYWVLPDDFEVPQLCRFINRSEHFKQTLPRTCRLAFLHRLVELRIATSIPGNFSVRVVCEGTDWQISQITHALGRISPLLSDMVRFTILGVRMKSDPEEVIELVTDNILWLQLLRLFPSVQTLLVFSQFAGHVSRALEDIAGVMVTEVLPTLDLLCLQDQPMSSVDKFIAVRQDSGHPVTCINCTSEYYKRLRAYP